MIEKNKKRWYKTPEFLFHAPWGLILALLFLFGTLKHSTGMIQVGVVVLVGASLSLAIMVYGFRVVLPAMEKKIFECCPNAQF